MRAPLLAPCAKIRAGILDGKLAGLTAREPTRSCDAARPVLQSDVLARAAGQGPAARFRQRVAGGRKGVGRASRLRDAGAAADRAHRSDPARAFQRRGLAPALPRRRRRAGLAARAGDDRIPVAHRLVHGPARPRLCRAAVRELVERPAAGSRGPPAAGAGRGVLQRQEPLAGGDAHGGPGRRGDAAGRSAAGGRPGVHGRQLRPVSTRARTRAGHCRRTIACR